MAAGALILEQAGGCLSCMDGTSFDINRGNIVATNNNMHKE